MAPSALVMARAGGAPEGLVSLLGAEAAARLEEVLLEVTVAWAAEAVGGDRVVVERGGVVATAARGVFERFGGGPVLVVGTTVPRLTRAHAAGALADMEAGADASFGPALDGAYYLLALREPREELLATAPEDWAGPTVMAKSLRVAAELELDIGLLRTERTLEGPEDVAAFLADPLLPAGIRAALAA